MASSATKSPKAETNFPWVIVVSTTTGARNNVATAERHFIKVFSILMSGLVVCDGQPSLGADSSNSRFSGVLGVLKVLTMALLTGRVAIVTGASKGIGRVISQLFAREGARVACAARSADLLMAAVDEIEQSGGQAIAVASDVSREEDARRLVAETIEKFGSLDCLVNNAGDSGPTAPVQ